MSEPPRDMSFEITPQPWCDLNLAHWWISAIPRSRPAWFQFDNLNSEWDPSVLVLEEQGCQHAIRNDVLGGSLRGAVEKNRNTRTLKLPVKREINIFLGQCPKVKGYFDTGRWKFAQANPRCVPFQPVSAKTNPSKVNPLATFEGRTPFKIKQSNY